MGILNNFDWDDMAISGALAEEIAEEETELFEIQKEFEAESIEAEDIENGEEI